MLALLLLLLLVEVALPVAMALGRNRLIFLPSATPGPEAGLELFPRDVEARVVRLGRPDGRLLAAYDHLVAEGVSPRRLVLYGESLGGAVALELVSERPVAGVVLQAPFASLSSLARRLYPWLPLAAVLVRGDFPNAARLRRLAVPVLMMHGTEDEIIPFAEGRSLHAAAPAGTEFLPIEGAGHNDLFEVGGEEYLRGLGERFRAWTEEPGR